MPLSVVWTPEAAELDGDLVCADRAVGFEGLSAPDPEIPQGIVVTVGTAGYGKGASGAGIAVILEVGEHALNDVASLIGIGYALRALIRKVSERRGRAPVGASSTSLAALAAAGTPAIAEASREWYHCRTVPLTTDGSVGTDMRDVWASAFVNDARGVLQVVFASSTTRYLGSAIVGIEWWFDGNEGHIRTDDQLAEALAAWY